MLGEDRDDHGGILGALPRDLGHRLNGAYLRYRHACQVEVHDLGAPLSPCLSRPGIAGASFFFEVSATMASVVIIRPAIEAASCSATRTTLAGSTMPALSMSTYCSVWASKPKVWDLFSSDLADDDRALDACVFGDLADRRLERPEHDVDAGLDVGILVAELADRGLGAQERDAAARNDAFLDRRLGRVHRVVDAILLLLHLDLGRAADADHRDAARQLRQALLQLLLVIVGGRLLDLRLDLRDAALDVGFFARRRR